MPADQNMISLQVELGTRSYPIRVGSDLLASMASFVKDLDKVTHIVAIYDEAVSQHADLILSTLRDSSIRISKIAIPSGEASKSLTMLDKIWMEMLAAKTDRASVVMAIGGGVIGDLAGFGAATFVRGLRLIQIPTTLLSQVDSSVGGKTGINLPQAKNIVGAFYQPSLVVIDTKTLYTLPDREFRSGIAEVIKYGVIMDEPFFAWLEKNAANVLQRDGEALKYVISRCCNLKAQVVQADEFETTGKRAILNYGHTFGHALEAATSYGQLLHGEAVSIGMSMAGLLATELQSWSPACLQRQTALLKQFGLPTSFNQIPVQQIVDLMASDKKSLHGRIGFVLPTRIGHVDVGIHVDRTKIEQTLSKFGCPSSSGNSR
jgi:3-dehydroquinate synthase